MYFKFVTFAACVALQVAGHFNFTLPVEGATFQAGQAITITWDGTDIGNQDIHISLVAGDIGDLQKISDLGDAHLADRSLTVNIPDTVDSNTDYSIFGQSGDDKNYSHPFTIKGGPNAQPRPEHPKPIDDPEPDSIENNASSNQNTTSSNQNTASSTQDNFSSIQDNASSISGKNSMSKDSQQPSASSNPASFGTMTVPSIISLFALLIYFI